MNRRYFFTATFERIAAWLPWLALLGVRFHAYANPASVGFAGWLTWGHRTIAYVPFRR